MIDYEAELKEISAGWIKLGTGTHNITITSEPTLKTDTYDNEERTQLVMDVKTEDTEGKLSINKGMTEASFYGQFISWAAKHKDENNSVIGQTFKVFVKKKNDKRDFSILDDEPVVTEEKVK